MSNGTGIASVDLAWAAAAKASMRTGGNISIMGTPSRFLLDQPDLARHC
jgi:hypothetical protein